MYYIEGGKGVGWVWVTFRNEKKFYNSRVPIKQFHISRKTIDSNKNNTIKIQVLKSMFNACYSVLSSLSSLTSLPGS
jgi:hypothetical protein